MLTIRFSTLILIMNVVFGCSSGEPTATSYKEALTSEAAGKRPTDTSTNPTATPGAVDNTGTAGNAQSGLAILGANCETAGCHKDNGITLTKSTAIDDTTAGKGAHRGVQPVFTPSSIADIKAALAGR